VLAASVVPPPALGFFPVLAWANPALGWKHVLGPIPAASEALPPVRACVQGQASGHPAPALIGRAR